MIPSDEIETLSPISVIQSIDHTQYRLDIAPLPKTCWQWSPIWSYWRIMHFVL